ncbi:hypothetical protein E4U37_004145 [Claviceps purpurea]|nr:hypothetical protein E4U37_004145 [Claviceps purpurea]
MSAAAQNGGVGERGHGLGAGSLPLTRNRRFSHPQPSDFSMFLIRDIQDKVSAGWTFVWNPSATCFVAPRGSGHASAKIFSLGALITALVHGFAFDPSTNDELPLRSGISITMDASRMSAAIRYRVFKRIAITVFAFAAAAGIAFAFFRIAPENHIQRITETVKGWETSFTSTPKLSECRGFHDASKIWKASQLKRQRLRDDKFTIAMQTYRRPKELNETLNGLLSEKIPSLSEVVVVWNDLETTPPESYTSKHGVPVRFRQSPVNSLNQKLWPDPAYQTQAIFLSDDDIFYKPRDLEFVFQTWRKFGRRRMTGGFARCTIEEANHEYKYSFCSTDDAHNNYNMILSGLSFAHISFLDYYSSNDALATKIRAYVDQHFNCEDIAMNYLVSMLTGEGPLLVKGKDPYVMLSPPTGISTKPGHLEARTQCLNDFNKLFGCMPLIEETGHIELGVILS